MNPTALEPVPVPGNNEIRDILEKRIEQQKQAVGIVVGIIEPDGRRIIAHGKPAKDDPRTVDGDTIFEIGSLSKIFTSLLLADMVNRQEVALEDPAALYLPPHVRVPERNGKSITLLDLSTHRSGLPSLPGNLKLKNPFNPYAAYGVTDMYQFLSGYTLPRDPGSEFEYSNLGAGLLGHALACRAGTDYEGLVRDRITRPLGMPDTGITLSPSLQQRMSTGHSAMLAPVATWDLPTLAGAGALRSSAHDMLTLMEAFLGFRQSPLASAMKTMFEIRRSVGQGEMGLAWFFHSGDGREIAWHNGGTGGFRSFLGCVLKDRTAVVVLSNAGGVDDIGFHLLNPKMPLANPEPPKQHTELQIEPTLLDNYTGRYQVNPNLIFEITREGDRLFARGFAQINGEATALPRFELFAEDEKRFFAKVSDSQITFETDAGGPATKLVLHRAGRDLHAPRVPDF